MSSGSGSDRSVGSRLTTTYRRFDPELSQALPRSRRSCIAATARRIPYHCHRNRTLTRFPFDRRLVGVDFSTYWVHFTNRRIGRCRPMGRLTGYRSWIMVRIIVAGVLAAFSCACMATEDPLTRWIFTSTNMHAFPPGFNNCTFLFPPNASFDPDAVCSQKAAGHGGYYRQQYLGLYLPSRGECNGGPGDVAGIRVCRVPDDDGPLDGQYTPCGLTGADGCSECFFFPTTCD